MKKLLFDFFPIVVFFAAYKYYDDIVIATAYLIPATLFQVGYSWWRTRKIEKMYIVTLVLVVLLGGATLILQDKTFIQWKPSVVNWLFAVAFMGSEFIGKKNLLERMMGSQIELPRLIWRRLNYMWSSFFVFIGVLNVYVAFSGHYSEEAWVNFKLFGMLGLTFVFIILQGLYLARHISPVENTDSDQQSD